MIFNDCHRLIAYRSKISFLFTVFLLGVQSLSLEGKETYRRVNTIYPIAFSNEGTFFNDFTTKEMHLSDIVCHLPQSLDLSPLNSFTMLTESTDFLGFNHVAYQQFFRDIPVEEGMVLLHARNGLTTTVNGRVGRLPENFSILPVLDAHKAIDIATEAEHLKRTTGMSKATLVIAWSEAEHKYVLSYKVNMKGLDTANSYTNSNVFIDANTGKVVNVINLIAHAAVPGTAHTLYNGVQSITMDDDSGYYRLYDATRDILTLNFDKGTYQSGVYSDLMDYTNSSTTWDEVWNLDSVSITTIGDNALIRDSRIWRPILYVVADSNATTPIQGPVPDNIRPNGAPYIFSELGLNLLLPPYDVHIALQNSNSGAISGSAYFKLDSAALLEGIHPWSDNRGNKGYYKISKGANVALDVHWGMERTYDFYKDKFDRASYDDRNGSIINLVNACYVLSGSQANAAALGNGVMIFGLGEPTVTKPMVCLDILGHEFSHMVTPNQGKLVLQGESGALNESFSDIMGTCIEFYAKGTDANWTYGEDAYIEGRGFLRSLSNPKLAQNPDTYLGQHWVTAAYDNGGIHFNCGVQNKWFYLLTEGGTGTNDKKDQYQVTGIGIEKAQQIVYRNLIYYITPYAKYIDAYRGALQAAADLYGKDGAEFKAVKDAWFAVGIDENATHILSASALDVSFKVYPNPATNQVQISAVLAKRDMVSITFTDMNGRIVLQRDFGNVAAGRLTQSLDVSALSSGSYLVELCFGGERMSCKAILHH